MIADIEDLATEVPYVRSVVYGPEWMLWDVELDTLRVRDADGCIEGFHVRDIAFSANQSIMAVHTPREIRHGSTLCAQGEAVGDGVVIRCVVNAWRRDAYNIAHHRYGD